MTFPPPRSSRSATAPPPISNIPPLDLPFQGRDDQIARLLELFEQYGHVLLHDGVAPVQGFGKTQVAIAYCRAYTRRYDVAWWFSCRGETDDDRLCGLLEEQYQALREERARAFGAKVEHRPDNRWLFVYDDVSNPDRVYEHFVPGTGHRLVTSRSCGETWGSNRLELGGMTVEQSSRLLLDQAENLGSKQAKHLASLMNGHPAQLLAVAEEVRRTSYERCARILTPAPPTDPDTPPGGIVVIPQPRDDSSGAPLSGVERRHSRTGPGPLAGGAHQGIVGHLAGVRAADDRADATGRCERRRTAQGPHYLGRQLRPRPAESEGDASPRGRPGSLG
ncbi:hypothetical protein ACRJ4B_19770 [Streptomyces sp. GTA36]